MPSSAKTCVGWRCISVRDIASSSHGVVSIVAPVRARRARARASDGESGRTCGVTGHPLAARFATTSCPTYPLAPATNALMPAPSSRLVARVGRPDGEIGNEAAIRHLQHACHRVRDVFGVQLGRVLGTLSRPAGAGEELREHLARIDLHDADVVLPELCPPAFGESGEGELAGAVCGSSGIAAGPGGGGDIDDVAAAVPDEMPRGLARDEGRT